MEKLKNEEIKSPILLVIGENGEKIGNINLEEAIALAKSKEKDLIQITNDEIPVCKIAVFSKFIYEEKKKEKSQHKPDSSSKMKEVKVKTAIGEHDLATKISQINSFLNKGNKVQLTIQLNRTQRDKLDLAKSFSDKILAGLSHKYTLLGTPSKKDNTYIVLLNSGKKG